MLCLGCGEEFTPKRKGQIHHSRNCRPRDHGHELRAERRRRNEIEFIGVDGEGVTRSDGSHDYILLTIGDKHLADGGKRIGTLAIFEFLYEQFLEHPRACFVGFYLGYDFAQWFRDLPAERAEMLFSKAGIAKRRRTAMPNLPPFPVEWQGWQFDIMGTRRFKLKRSNPVKAPWLTVCDTGAFFQCSFLKAIDPSKATTPVVTPEEFAVISKGKDGRRSHRFGPEMMRYNALECDILARLMRQQNEGLIAEGIKLKRQQWIGPGQAAQQWLNKIEAPKGEEVRQRSSPTFRDAARASYYGGWFEMFWHGPVPGQSHGYDINSAYPKIMSGLPCLLHGRYYDDDRGSLALVKALVVGTHPSMGAMLHRTRKHTVLRPRQTYGWFWRHELEASKRAGFIDRYKIDEALSYEPCSCPPPLRSIAELYAGRLAIGKNTPAGKARKLIYNSAYGKHAQSIGTPAYGNAIYASLITAGCRVMIIEAIASHPKGARDLLMVATDGVVFKTPHETLDIDANRLGAWTYEPHSNLSLFMPGVYWDDDTRQRLRSGDDPLLKSRGIAARDLAARIDRLDAAWSRYDRDGYPRLVLPIGFQLVSPKQALARGKWKLCGSVVTDGARIISADPKLKRIGYGPGRSRPYTKAGSLVTTPYERAFGEELALFAELELGDHPDGPLGDILASIFHS